MISHVESEQEQLLMWIQEYKNQFGKIFSNV